MATLTLEIGKLKSSITVGDKVAVELCSDAWEASHLGETATDQEKLDWVVDVLLREAIGRGAERLGRVRAREQRRLEHERRRGLRMEERESRLERRKFE